VTVLGTDFRLIPPVPFGSMVRHDPAKVNTGSEARHGRRAFLGRVHNRRFACLKAAEGALDLLPDAGEDLHLVMDGTYDLMHLVVVLLRRLAAPCTALRVATLSLSRRNVQEMAALYDDGWVQRLDLLTSDFFRRHDDAIFAELVQEVTGRGQRVAAARSHCKIVTIALEDVRRYVLHGSPNLRTNKNLEQVCLSRDAGLHAFYDAWLSDMVARHEIRQNDGTPAG
jgi:hypothetical protein